MARPPADPFAKPFAWSYSKLKNYETCPKRHYHVDLMRDIREEMSEEVLWGNRLHDALAKAIGTDDNALRDRRDQITQAPLPPEFQHYAPWAQRFRKAREANARVYTELSLAITRQFQPCPWFDPAAWYRAKVDAMLVTQDTKHAFAADWKTGKRKEDSPQLMMTALTVFAHYPQVEAIRTEFVWLKEWNGLDDKASMERVMERVSFRRADMVEMWNSIALRAARLETAFANRHYPEKPSGICRSWCPVVQCPSHGGSRR